MQIWKIDINGIFTGESYFVEEPTSDEITSPITVGYVKAKWTGTEWMEGATAEEITAWQEEQNNQPKSLTEIEQLRLDQAQANSEIIDLILALTGGM